MDMQIGPSPDGQKKKNSTGLIMNINCQDHRKSMELLELKLRLKKGINDSKALEEVQTRIKILEKELKLD